MYKLLHIVFMSSIILIYDINYNMSLIIINTLLVNIDINYFYL